MAILLYLFKSGLRISCLYKNTISISGSNICNELQLEVATQKNTLNVPIWEPFVIETYILSKPLTF